MAYAKALRENLDRIATQMKAMVTTAEKDSNRGFTAEEVVKYHAMVADYDGIEASIKIAERTETIGNDLRNVSRDQAINEFPVNDEVEKEKNAQIHSRAFSKYLRNGMERMDADEKQFMQRSFLSNIQNAQSTTTTQGGYLVPQGFSGQLEEAKKWFGGIDGVVGKFQTASGNPWPWPTLNDTSNKGRIIGQNVQVTETDLVFGQVTFNAYIGSSDLVLIPLALMEDSYFDIDGLIARLLGTRLGRLYNQQCTVGSGSGAPTGIVTAAVTAGSTYTFPTGNTTGLPYASLVNVEHTVDPAYRYQPSSRWMFADAQLKVLKLLVDGNARPLWQPGLTASFREGAAVDITASMPTILDHPYIVNQDMAVPAANADSLLFGDMSTFKVREVAGGTTVLRLVERYADYLQIGFIAFQRFDSQLVDAGTHPIAIGVNSAS